MPLSGGAMLSAPWLRDAPAWLPFIDGGNIEVYDDPNTPNLPGYAVLAPGVYAVSLDPLMEWRRASPGPRPPTITARTRCLPRVWFRITARPSRC